MNVSLTINGQQQLDQSLAKFTGLTGEEVATASTQPTREITSKHFYGYATAHPNKFGATSTGYWAVSYTHLTLPTTLHECRSRWSPYH